MSEPVRVVRVGTASSFTPVRVGPGSPSPADVVVGVNRPELLDDLGDVEGAAAAPAGYTLVKGSDGRWRPAPAGSGGGPGGPQEWVHVQSAPAQLWQIVHTLGYRPAGIVITDTDTPAGLIECDRIDWPADDIVELSFGAATAGSAHLS